jgi:hypothetical protein
MRWIVDEIFEPRKSANELQDGEMFMYDHTEHVWIVRGGEPWALRLHVADATGLFPAINPSPSNFGDRDRKVFRIVTLKRTP